MSGKIKSPCLCLTCSPVYHNPLQLKPRSQTFMGISPTLGSKKNFTSPLHLEEFSSVATSRVKLLAELWKICGGPPNVTLIVVLTTISKLPVAPLALTYLKALSEFWFPNSSAGYYHPI